MQSSDFLLACINIVHLLQLRGLSQKRQVPGAQVALQQNFGIGGAAVVTLYKKYHAHHSHLTSKL